MKLKARMKFQNYYCVATQLLLDNRIENTIILSYPSFNTRITLTVDLQNPALLGYIGCILSSSNECPHIPTSTVYRYIDNSKISTFK